MKTQHISTLDKNEMKTLVKAIYKYIHKNIAAKNKKRQKNTEKIVEDILDPNYIAEVDPDDIPSEKRSVLYKGKSLKSKEKGIKKLKKYMDIKTAKSSNQKEKY